MVIAKSIEKWLEDRRRRRLEAAREIALKEGHEEGRQEGRAEERQLWRDWLARREKAEARGESFTELPPNGKL